MCHIKAIGKLVCFGVCVRHTFGFPFQNPQTLDHNCVLMKYGESSVSENGVESLQIVERIFVVIIALDTNAVRVEEVIWNIDG
jgi:hypothetical protein